MTQTVEHLEREAARVRDLAPADVASLPRAELMELQESAIRLKRHADALVAWVAGEVGRRSAPEDGARGLARQAGYSSPGRMLAHSAGVSVPEATRMIEVGQTLATAPVAGDNDDDRGEGGGRRDEGDEASGCSAVPRPKHPHVGRGVREGRLSVEAASIITRGLRQLDDCLAQGRVSTDRLDEVEARLTDKAATLPLGQVRSMVQRAVAQLDVAGLEQREERAYRERTVTVRERGEMVEINARLDAVTAAPLVTMLDAVVTQGFRARREQDPLARDTRTVVQMRADALSSMARHVQSCDHTPHGAVKTTVVVRMGLEDLENRLRAAREDGDVAPGVGVGEVDGLSQPISVAALRRLCTDVEVIPHVLGGEGETLDLGRARRLFSPAQRLALVERDGGCAWCHAPPSHCEAHHLRWWDKHHGRTDLSNGLLLCTSCHHRIHRDGWDISVQSGTVWFTPPTSVDSRRQPVLGGRAAVELSRDELSARDRAKNMATA